MNFTTLDEMEFYELGSVRGQLRLMSNLLASRGVPSSALLPADVHAFIDAQVMRLSSVIDTLQARADEFSAHQSANMTAQDWLLLVDALSGQCAVKSNHDAMTRVAAKLQLAAQADPDMQDVADAFTSALEARREPLPATRKAGVTSRTRAAPSKRERLLAKA